MRITYRQLWWDMAGGVQTEYEKIKALDVFEFWAVFDLWRDKVKRDTINYRNGKR